MRQIFTILTAIFFFLPASAMANAIVVRSGEHDTFTRLVMQLPEGVEWSLLSGEFNSILELEGHRAGFDLTDAFAIIPRTRLNALVATNSRLQLQLGCACLVQGFVEQNRFLVLDISDASNGLAETNPVIKFSVLPTTSFAVDDLLWSQYLSIEQQPSRIAQPADPVTHDGDENTGRSTSQKSQVANSRRQLLDAFSQAASVGLVTTTRPAGEPSLLVPNGSEEPEVFDSSEEQVREIGGIKQNLRITSSKDQPTASHSNPMTLDGRICPEGIDIDIASWSTSSDLGAEIARSNKSLYDELGRINASEVVKRARTYIYFGFGAEAKQTLNLIPSLALEFPELHDISQVLEHGYMRNPVLMHQFANCDSDHALWGILATKKPIVGQEVESLAALRALEKLPDHLKYIFARELGERFLEMDEIESASIALRTLERLQENNSDTPKIARAMAERKRQNDFSANTTLDQIIEADTAEAPRAVIALISQHIADDTSVPPDIALLAEAFAFELKNSGEGPEMFAAYVQAAAKSAQYVKAFEALEKTPGEMPQAKKNDLENFVVAQLTSHADDLEFLENYFNQIQGKQSRLSPRVALELAERLISLGFFDDAETNLAQPMTGEDMEKSKLLFAKIHFERKEYPAALAQLETLQGKHAARLRGRVLQALDEHLLAAANFQEASEDSSANLAKWLADEWPEWIDSDHPTFGSALQLTTEDITSITVDNNMLAASDATISASAQARRKLTDFLQKLELSE